ncbi:MAG: TetR/AcrR family transcriptional regulator [Anaerolineales bacterium]|jgi:AcrR family transcriptional regulator
MARTVKITEDRREQIMEAALKVFAKKGFAGASNKDIAREAGITPGLIYHYFESKEALLKAIMDDSSPQRIIRTNPEQILALPPEQFLHLVVRQMLTVVEDAKYQQLLRIYLPEVIYHPETVPIGIANFEEGTRFVQGYLAAKMESGEFRKMDPGLVTRLVMGSVMNIALLRNILHDPLALQYSQEQIIESVVDLALNALLPG